MSGLFLSHSSKDKDAVTRLAIDLVNRGFPVWLDEWELETADSLTEKIFAEIDQSSYVLLVISEHSIAAEWVRKEMEAALSREQSIGRKFIVPVLIGDCAVPNFLGDRLYVDFRTSYLHQLEKLANVLKKWGVDKVVVPPERLLIPLVFTKGCNLNEVVLSKRVATVFASAPAGYEIGPNQFVISPDPTYSQLRHRLFDRVERIETDPHYSADFQHAITRDFNTFLLYEQRLLDGLAFLMNGLHDGYARWPTVARWFARIIRGEILSILYTTQNPDRPDILQPNMDCIRGSLYSNDSAAELFGVDTVLSCYLGPRSDTGSVGNPYMAVWIGSDCYAYTTMHNWPFANYSPLELEDGDLCAKYIYPQMLDRHYIDPEENPFSWDLRDYKIAVP